MIGYSLPEIRRLLTSLADRVRDRAAGYQVAVQR
jgi:hypothetical protein